MSSKLIQIALFGLTLGSAELRVVAQGYIAFNNLPPANGLVYLASDIPGGLLLDQDVNFALLAGTDSLNLQLISKWLLSDGSATGINVAPGRFADPNQAAYAVPGTEPGDAVYIVVMAWAGPVDSWEATGLHGIAEFWNPSGTADLPSSLTGMDSFIIGIPEPSSLALVLCGGALWLAARGRHNGGAVKRPVSL
ncbi:MAG: hypothetical protein M9920_01755 [Verrucomicrobiae bacterium]|nr:hypothetical protein [Verrucomicrobiae bacterium]